MLAQKVPWKLSLPCPGGKCECLLLTRGVQPAPASRQARRSSSLTVGLAAPLQDSRDWDAQSAHCSRPGAVLRLCNFPFHPRGSGSYLITFLPFLPDYLWIFRTTLIVQESFCQSAVNFQWEVLHFQMYLGVFVWWGEFHVFLLHRLDWCVHL